VAPIASRTAVRVACIFISDSQDVERPTSYKNQAAGDLRNRP
jgi:hypothetical protein